MGYELFFLFCAQVIDFIGNYFEFWMWVLVLQLNVSYFSIAIRSLLLGVAANCGDGWERNGII
jgi:hypothetical protein